MKKSIKKSVPKKCDAWLGIARLEETCKMIEGRMVNDAFKLLEQRWAEGELLAEAKETTPHGEWESKLKAAGVLVRSAHHYIELRKKFQNKADLKQFKNFTQARQVLPDAEPKAIKETVKEGLTSAEKRLQKTEAVESENIDLRKQVDNLTQEMDTKTLQVEALQKVESDQVKEKVVHVAPVRKMTAAEKKMAVDKHEGKERKVDYTPDMPVVSRVEIVEQIDDLQNRNAELIRLLTKSQLEVADLKKKIIGYKRELTKLKK